MVLRPEGLANAILVIFTIVPLISTITFALRLYVQLKLTKQFKTYEALAAGIGWLLFIAYSCVFILTAFHGVGQNVFALPLPELKTLLMLGWIADPIYIVSNMAVKQSISLMLLRYAMDQYRTVIFIVTFVLQVCSTVALIINIFQCIPISYFWTRVQGTQGRCMDLEVLVVSGYLYSTVTILYDLTMALLPWFLVRKLQLDLQTKVMVTGVLALGSIASIATIARMPFIVKLAHLKDYLHSGIYISILSCFETGLSVTASSAATLKPLFRNTKKVQPSVRTTSRTLVQHLDGNSRPTNETKEYDIEFSSAFYGNKTGRLDQSFVNVQPIQPL